VRRKLRCIAIGISVALVVLASPLSASAESNQRVTIGFHMQITGPNSAAGTFSAAGRVSDSGAAVATFSVTPIRGDRARLEGDHTLTGSGGVISIHFRGTTFPVNSPRALGDGRFQITGGTGAHSGLRGHGTFVVVADFTTLTVTGTYDGRVKQS
jgi:hypothetical protein